MKYLARIMLVAMVLPSVIACASINEKRSIWFRDRGDDYLTSKVLPQLRTPADLPNPINSQQYPLPDNINNTELADFNLEPPGFGKQL
jgi:uncharacterized lipoprotein